MNLRDCFDNNGCDKGYRHGYERVYEPAFRDLRQEPLRLLEIGIYKGASLAAWIDYFPNATVVGIDTFQRVKPKDIPILNHTRVEWHRHDSTTPLDLGHFDIIIDDGLHTHVSQRKTFDNLMPSASMYFIEDVWPYDRMDEKQMQHPWISAGPLRGQYSDADYQHLLRSVAPYSPEFHDLRKGHNPDSFIISARA